jgi:hypothetical protein
MFFPLRSIRVLKQIRAVVSEHENSFRFVASFCRTRDQCAQKQGDRSTNLCPARFAANVSCTKNWER